MTGGTVAATAHGPSGGAGDVNHTPLCTPYHSVGSTMMMGDGELNT